MDIPHFKGQAHGTSNNSKYELEDILVENSSYTNIYRLKQRIFKANLIEYKCAFCGIDS